MTRQRRGGATHPWTLCRPVVAPTTGRAAGDGADARALDEAISAAAQRVWATLGQREKRLFHEHVCEDRQTDTHRTSVALFQAAVAKQAADDERRHAETARKVLAFMEEAGVQVMDPQPGQKVQVICTRVTDTMKLGDDPHPALAARRQITTCTRCGHNVFIDPQSFGAADPEPICLRCIDPRMDAEMDRAIEEATRRQGGGEQ